MSSNFEALSNEEIGIRIATRYPIPGRPLNAGKTTKKNYVPVGEIPELPAITIISSAN